MSGASLYMQKDLEITDVQVEILMGILSIYSIIGTLAAGRTSDWIGRRFTAIFAAFFFFLPFVVGVGAASSSPSGASDGSPSPSPVARGRGLLGARCSSLIYGLAGKVVRHLVPCQYRSGSALICS